MTNQIDQIVEHLFNKKNLDDVSIYELERFIATHPYFAAGHLLLAKKAQADRSADTQDKAARVALYYNNHLWLQWLLDEDVQSRQGKQYQHDTGDQNGHDADNREALSGETTTETVEVRDKHSAAETDFLEAHSNNSQEDAPVAYHEGAATSGPENEFFETETENSPDLGTESSVEERNDYKQPEETREPEKVDIYEEQVTHPNENLQEVKDLSAGHELGSEENSSQQQTEVLNDAAATEAVEQEADTIEVSREENLAKNIDVEAAEEKALTAGIEKTLSAATLIPTRAEIENNEFTFEPYHTIDYFASQGIKLQQSDLSKDKFGKQLKSFTEWLRSMKRLPQPAADGTIDEATQHTIQMIAEHSFEEKDIVTETMAEVWIKQGNKEKAIDTLHKLSLQNPSKSHYFAARIEQLKAS